MLEQDGWRFDSQTGSHRHFKHPVKPGKVTVPVHGSKDLQGRILHSILKQAGFK